VISNAQLILFGLAIVVAAILAWVQGQAEAAHRRAMAAYAAARGWTYKARVDRYTEIAPGEPFGEGRARQAHHVMFGPFGGYRASAFEYRYTTGSGKSRRTHYHGVFALSLPVGLPWVHVRPETSLVDAAARLFGGQDIDFESEDFNRRFRVRADDARFAYDLLNPRAMQLLLASDDICVQVAGHTLVLTTEGRLEVRHIDHRLMTLVALCEGLPGYVWTDRGAGPPPPTGLGRSA
jgi:hypothetical protein